MNLQDAIERLAKPPNSGARWDARDAEAAKLVLRQLHDHADNAEAHEDECKRLTRERDEAKHDQEETQNVYDAIIREHREALESCGLSRVSDKGSLKNDEAIDAHKIMAKEISSLRLALTQAQGDAGAMREALEWYERAVSQCAKFDAVPGGVEARAALAKDIGERARAALRSSAGKEFAERMRLAEAVCELDLAIADADDDGLGDMERVDKWRAALDAYRAHKESHAQ